MKIYVKKKQAWQTDTQQQFLGNTQDFFFLLLLIFCFIENYDSQFLESGAKWGEKEYLYPKTTHALALSQLYVKHPCCSNTSQRLFRFSQAARGMLAKSHQEYLIISLTTQSMAQIYIIHTQSCSALHKLFVVPLFLYIMWYPHFLAFYPLKTKQQPLNKSVTGISHFFLSVSNSVWMNSAWKEW